MDTEGIECHRRRPSTPLRWDDHQVLYEANEFYCGATCISSNPVCSRAIIQLFCNCFGIGIVVLAAATIIRERWDVCRVRGLPFAGCWWWGRWWRPEDVGLTFGFEKWPGLQRAGNRERSIHVRCTISSIAMRTLSISLIFIICFSILFEVKCISKK